MHWRHWLMGLWLMPLTASAQWIQPAWADAQAQAGLTAVHAPLRPSVWGNPASLAALPGTVLQLGVLQPGPLPEFRTVAAGAAFPLPGNQGMGIGMSSIGFGGYAETTVGLAYARQLHPHWQFGARMGNLWVQLPEFGAAHTWWVDVGATWQPKPAWQVGLIAVNAQRQRISERSQPLPGLVQLGVRHDLSAQVAVQAGWEQRLDLPTGGLLASLWYQPTPEVHVLLGLRTEPWQVSLGGGWRYRQISVTAASSYDPRLGLRPTLTLDYVWMRKPKEGG